MASLGKKARTTGSVLDVLLWDGQIEPHQHAAALAYAKLRRKAQSLGFARMKDAFPNSMPTTRPRYAWPGSIGLPSIGWP